MPVVSAGIGMPVVFEEVYTVQLVVRGFWR